MAPFAQSLVAIWLMLPWQHKLAFSLRKRRDGYRYKTAMTALASNSNSLDLFFFFFFFETSSILGLCDSKACRSAHHRAQAVREAKQNGNEL